MEKIKKLLSAFNIFQKVEEVLISKVIAKGVKVAVQTLIGIVAANKFLGEAGVTIDFTKLESWGIVALSGVVGSLWNWVKKRYEFQK